MKFESPPFCTKKDGYFLHKNQAGVLFEFQYPGDLGTRTLGACWAKIGNLRKKVADFTYSLLLIHSSLKFRSRF